MKPVRFPRKDNPHYPLPPDYPDLSPENQTRARLNAVCLQETPYDLVQAWAFFRNYYLKPEEAHWYKRWKASPPMHYLMLHDMGKFSRNVWAAPREFSKSTVLREAMMLFTLTRPHFFVSYIMATIKKYRKAIEFIRWQFENNPFICNDFQMLYGEPLKAKRGARPWGSEILWLPNGSILEGGSVDSALRGDRPDLLGVDDPEYDEDEGSDQFKLLEDFEKLLFKTMLPMLARGCGLFWIGTLITRQAYIYQVTKGEDPRFHNFNRRVLTIQDEKGHSVWEAKWSKQIIEDLKEERGDSSFQAEYMNNPGSASARLLKLHPEFGWYHVDGAPEKLSEPFQSEHPMTYPKRVHEGDNFAVIQVEEPFGIWASRLYRMITVDYIRKPSPTSDYACIGVWGFDAEDTLFVLDLFLERLTGASFIRKIFTMALKWRARIIGTEAVPIQEEVAAETAELIQELAAGTGYVPRVFPIRYAKRRLKNTDAPTAITKPERIAALESRFVRGKIRLPAHRRREFGIAQLINQIENFTLDLSFLRFDDALDTLAMCQYVPRRRGTDRPDRPRPSRVSELLKAGELVDPHTGIPYLSGADAQVLTNDVIDALTEHRFTESPPAEERMPEWEDGPILFRY